MRFILEAWRDARNRVLANQRYQRWAASFALTKPIARHHAHALFDLCAGFVYSQVLLACVRLRLFDLLADGARTGADLAAAMRLPADNADRLLRAAISLGLVERRGGDQYGLGMRGAALVGNPSIAAMVEHHAMLYDDLRDPVALLRGEGGATRLAAFWPYASGEAPTALSGEKLRPYTALMAQSQELIAGDVLDAYDFSRHECLLDVGGGNGAFIAAVAARAERLKLLLFDLPPIAALARERFEAARLAPRAQAFGGSFRTDPLPVGADIVTLVRVLHDHDDAVALELLQAVRRAISNDGVLLVAEPMSDTRGVTRIADAYFGFYLLAMGSGHPRSPERIGNLLERSGFRSARMVQTRRPFLVRALIASPIAQKV